MATYSSVNGKAPSGLSVGDKVVTNGGTYTITGVNANGSYTSAKTSDTNKSNYTGSYATAPSTTASSGSASGVSVSSGSSSSGSSAYSGSSGSSSGFTNTTGGRVLESVGGLAPAGAKVGDYILTNGGIYEITGGSMGSWTSQKVSNLNKSTYTGPRDTAQQQTYQAELNSIQQLQSMLSQATMPETYTPTDNSNYLRQMAEANLAQKQIALRSAYEENLASLQAEQEKLAGRYSAAMDAESSDNALARQRWNETAAAFGLNSGTRGQAELAFTTQNQAGLSQLRQAEASANAEVERQRTQLGEKFQSQMNEALAANNYELFQQLYEEAVRLDKALESQQEYNASLILKQYQTALDQYNEDRNYNYNQQLNEWQQQYQQQKEQAQTALESAKLLATGGDYSALGSIYGWDEETVNRMNTLWQASQTSKTASKSSSGGSSSGSGELITDALEWAARTGGNAEDYIKSKYKSYGYSSQSAALSSLNMYLVEHTESMSDISFQQFMRVVTSNLQSGSRSGALQMVERNWDKLSIQQQVKVREALAKLNVDLSL